MLPNVISRSDLRAGSDTASGVRHEIVKLVLLALILALIYALDAYLRPVFESVMEKELASTIFLSILSIVVVSTCYYIYRVYVSITSYLVGKLSVKPSVRPALPTILSLNRILGLVIAVLMALWLLSVKIPFLYGIVRGIAASFSGLFSILIALVLALQVKEIVGNYLAGIIIKSSGTISDGEFLTINDEYLNIEKVDSAYTLLVNRFGERVYVPNLKFLVDIFRKPFSKWNIRYIDLKFSLPYKYRPEEVRQKLASLIDRLNKQDETTVLLVDDYRLLMADLANYCVVYELQVRPLKPVFPETLRSNIRQLLHQEFGEDLATPTMVNIAK
jgi:small-conductance mechanosensitive channel